MTDMELYTVGRMDTVQRSSGDRGLYVYAVGATAQNECLQGEVTWRSNNETTGMQSAHQKVSNRNSESFHHWFSPSRYFPFMADISALAFLTAFYWIFHPFLQFLYCKSYLI